MIFGALDFMGLFFMIGFLFHTKFNVCSQKISSTCVFLQQLMILSFNSVFELMILEAYCSETFYVERIWDTRFMEGVRANRISAGPAGWAKRNRLVRYCVIVECYFDERDIFRRRVILIPTLLHWVGCWLMKKWGQK